MTLEFNESGFDVIGITIRTSNKEAINQKTVEKHWQRFIEENTLSKIPNKINDNLIALYYNYENKRNGAYDLLLGAAVSSINHIPEGMSAQHIPEAKCMVLASEVGPINTVVFDLWKEIWALEDESEINRTYLFDYELYDFRSRNPQNAQVDIHIGIQK